MSLLGPAHVAQGWLPGEGLQEPDCDARQLGELLKVAADLLRRGGPGGRFHALGCSVTEATNHLRLRLEDGRIEAALVRRALNLPTLTSTAETVRHLTELRSTLCLVRSALKLDPDTTTSDLIVAITQLQRNQRTEGT